MGEEVIMPFIVSSISVPLVFGDDSLWFWSDPCQCLQVKCYEVFSIITKLNKPINLSSLIIPFTAVHPLEDVDT